MKVCYLQFITIDISILLITGEYTCQIDDDRAIKTSGYLYVEGRSYLTLEDHLILFFVCLI
jgi:hypothetical protein